MNTDNITPDTDSSNNSTLLPIINTDNKNIDNKNTARVFLFEQLSSKNTDSINIDINQAADFGIIVPLFKAFDKLSKVRTRPSNWDTEDLQDAIISRLEEYNFNPNIDYILIAGSNVPMVVFAVTVVNWFDCEEGIRFLFWSPKWYRYVEKRL